MVYNVRPDLSGLCILINPSPRPLRKPLPLCGYPLYCFTLSVKHSLSAAVSLHY
jgi:hypothetical protein